MAEQLPPELLLRIFSDPSLSYFDLLRLRTASHSFRELAACASPHSFTARTTSSHKWTEIDISTVATHPLLTWVKWIGVDPSADMAAGEEPELLLGFGGADRRQCRLSACGAAHENATSPSGPDLVVTFNTPPRRRLRRPAGITVANVLQTFWKALTEKFLGPMAAGSRIDIENLVYHFQISEDEGRRVMLAIDFSTFLDVCPLCSAFDTPPLPLRVTDNAAPQARNVHSRVHQPRHGQGTAKGWLPARVLSPRRRPLGPPSHL